MAGSAPPGSAMMPLRLRGLHGMNDVTLTEATWPRRTRAVPLDGLKVLDLDRAHGGAVLHHDPGRHGRRL